MSDVNVKYSDFLNSVTSEISFELIQDILLKLKYDKDNNVVKICMADTISENTELEGYLDYDKLNILIKVLSQIRNQVKNSIGGQSDVSAY